MGTKIILPHGGYRNLLTYQKSDLIYQGAVIFCRHGGIRERMYAARVETRGASWEVARADWLSAAPDAAEFMERSRNAQAALRRIAMGVKRRRGW